MQARPTRFTLCVVALACFAAPVWADSRAKFNIIGADAALSRDLRAASLLATLGKTDSAQDILAKAKADYGTLLDALYATGHYGAVINIYLDGVEAAEIAPLNVPDSIAKVQVRVDVGPQFTFSRARIGPVDTFAKMPEGFAAGAVASSTVILDTATAAVSRWRDLGHAKAQIAQQSLTADHRNNTLQADLTVDSGPKLRFGRLFVKGTDDMRPERVQAIAGLPTGEEFSPAKAMRSATRLRRTGAFRSVSLTEADQISPPDQLDITATLVEEKLRRYRFTGEIASQDGLSLGAELMHRNLFGGAERLTLSGNIAKIGVNAGGLDYDLGISFDRPATFSPDTTLNLGATLSRTLENEQRETALTLQGGLVHYFSDTLTGNANLAYHTARVVDPSGTTDFRALSLPIGAAWDTRGNKKDAVDGVAITAEVKPFYGLGFTESGVRMVWDARGYRSVTANDSVILAARIQAGAIFGASLAGTPRDDLFYSGGPATVRGQPYKSLGVMELADDTGDTFLTGGTHFLAGTVESRVRLGANWGMVGFLDMGHVDAESQFSLDGNWHAGAGIGLRYLTTIGPLRLDLAAPINGATGDGVQLYVGLGQAF